VIRKRQRRHDSLLKSLEAQTVRLRRDLAQQQAVHALAAAGVTSDDPPRSLADRAEDVFLWDLFGRTLRGTFVEAGAVDGLFLSTTHFLEAVGWTGLLVEPFPDMAERCRVNRPKSTTVTAALGSESKAEIAFHATGPDPEHAALSFASTNEEHRAHLDAKGIRPTAVTTTLSRLSDLLDEHLPGHGTLDVLVLDVEGAELDAVRGIDHDRHRFRAVLVEDLTRGENPAARRELQRFGYRYITTLFENDLLIHGTETELLDRVTYMLDKVRSPSRPPDRSLLSEA
jgi:FkbM family methyltransferase